MAYLHIHSSLNHLNYIYIYISKTLGGDIVCEKSLHGREGEQDQPPKKVLVRNIITQQMFKHSHNPK